jgi:deoxyribonuclease V
MTEHSFDVTLEQAVAIQASLRQKIKRQDELRTNINLLAGVDCGFPHPECIRAAIALFKYPDLTMVDAITLEQKVNFPYVPGLLSFREAPAILAAFAKLNTMPDLVLVDGQGIAHPRRLGIASHLGILLDLPTIGVAKTRLCGYYTMPVDEKGFCSPLMQGDEIIGAVLRTRAHVKPVFVSIGHKISLPTAICWVMNTVTRYRLPEPVRFAHRLASTKQR